MYNQHARSVQRPCKVHAPRRKTQVKSVQGLCVCATRSNICAKSVQAPPPLRFVGGLQHRGLARLFPELHHSLLTISITYSSLRWNFHPTSPSAKLFCWGPCFEIKTCEQHAPTQLQRLLLCRFWQPSSPRGFLKASQRLSTTLGFHTLLASPLLTLVYAYMKANKYITNLLCHYVRAHAAESGVPQSKMIKDDR